MSKRFEDLDFVSDNISNRHHANAKIGPYTISVGYGQGMYGDGPVEDGGSYEISVWYTDTDETVSLTSHDDVIGWAGADEVSALMRVLHTEPDFGRACNTFKRTGYNKKFSNIGYFRELACETDS